VIRDLFARFDPEPNGLLRAISGHITDDMLLWIASSDYGLRVDEHLAALRQVRDTGTFPEPMHWCPAEVLELTRWAEPDEPSLNPGCAGESGHWMRAFCCAALLRATREPWNYGDGVGTDSTLVQLVLSLSALPVDFREEAIKFLSWLMANSEPEGQDGQVCAYGVGLLWFALHRSSPVADEFLIELSEWIAQRADELYGRPYLEGNHGLREMVTLCQRQAAWEMLAVRIAELDLSMRSGELQMWVRLIGEQLIE
jgi:hypothetical protein